MVHEIDEEIFIEAVPAKIFAAWTEAPHVLAWWGDVNEFRTIAFESDLRVGGRWRAQFEAVTDKSLSSLAGEYRRVERPHFLSFTFEASWDPGSVTLVDLEFRASGTGTLVKLRHSGFGDGETAAGSKEVWNATLDWLRCYLTKKN